MATKGKRSIVSRRLAISLSKSDAHTSRMCDVPAVTVHAITVL